MAAKYRALRKTLISHLCLVVEEGQVFEAEFPKGMKLGDNIELVQDEPAPKAKGKASDSSGE